jgi:alcohol dehydrogenase/benzil reductase ((S)-benzoin forming)
LKNILITGCSSGLGLALTKLYLDKGYKVYGISRTNPDIHNTNFIFKAFDLSKTDEIKKSLSEFILNIKEIEIVFLNAGMLGKIKVLKDLTLDDLKEVNEINLYANKILLDICGEVMLKNVIAISSGASKNGSKGWAAYCLSKSNLNMLINLYANEFENTKFLAVAPGVIETPMTDHIRFEVDDTIFTSAKMLKKGEIQSPKTAAKRLDELINSIDTFKSGLFIDVREI